MKGLSGSGKRRYQMVDHIKIGGTYETIPLGMLISRVNLHSVGKEIVNSLVSSGCSLMEGFQFNFLYCY